jgi:peptide deformylase
MYQKIVTYGDSILRLPSQPLIITDHFDDLIQSLFDTLSQNRGIGLAAPQIGINQAAYINPEITWYNKKEHSFNEGCLSIPGIYENVVRPSSIHVRYLDASFNEVEETLYGIKARIFQHEYDHLEGILFVDHLHPLHKILIFHKLKKLQNNCNKHTK